MIDITIFQSIVCTDQCQAGELLILQLFNHFKLFNHVEFNFLIYSEYLLTTFFLNFGVLFSF